MKILFITNEAAILAAETAAQRAYEAALGRAHLYQEAWDTYVDAHDDRGAWAGWPTAEELGVLDGRADHAEWVSYYMQNPRMAWNMERIIVVNIAPILGALRRLAAWRPLSGLRGS